MAEKNMTSAIFKSLEDFNVPKSAMNLLDNAVAKKYLNVADFGKTYRNTWVGILVNFIRNGDKRIKRTKIESGSKNVWGYYLSNKEEQMPFFDDDIVKTEIISDKKEKKRKETNDNIERSLHKLFVSYLKNETIYSKTIFHENSTQSEKNQRWTHPDIVGVKFRNLEKSASDFLKTINPVDMFDVYSYELKVEIKNDTDLKEKYFQSVSNSSWANYGYLVALEIEDNLIEELKRLNQSFGIGFIKLSAKNPFESKIICQAKKKNLDFNTISKLCKQNPDFVKFIDKIKDIVSAEERYHKSTLTDFEKNVCDEYFRIDEDDNIEKYCKDKNIPIEDEFEESEEI